MTETSKNLEDFAICASFYVKEYARKLKKHQKSGHYFGHGDNILQALRIRETCEKGLKEFYSILTDTEKRNASKVSLAYFMSLREVSQRYQKKDIRRRVTEAVNIARGSHAKVEPVTDRFPHRDRTKPTLPDNRYYGRNNDFDWYTYCG